MRDRDVIDAFVAYLRDHGYPNLVIDCRPDEKNRQTPDIDAIAGPFAIEHTSVDTLMNQRRDSDWFRRVVGEIESETRTLLSFRLRVNFEWEAVARGQDWPAISRALKAWIVHEASKLPDGRSIVSDVAGVPYRLHVTKDTDRPPGVFFGRLAPNNANIPQELRSLFESKARKLQPYKCGDKTTVLLIENSDIALMNIDIMLDKIRQVFHDGLPAGVDQVWYVDTALQNEIEFHNFTTMLMD